MYRESQHYLALIRFPTLWGLLYTIIKIRNHQNSVGMVLGFASTMPGLGLEGFMALGFKAGFKIDVYDVALRASGLSDFGVSGFGSDFGAAQGLR